MSENNQIKALYIVYAKDELGLYAIDLYVTDSEELAIINFKKDHVGYDYGFELAAKIIDKCDGYKILVGSFNN
jgi:hypothetical protein